MSITKPKHEFPLLKRDTVIKYLVKNPDTRYWLLEIILDLLKLDLKEYTLIDNEINAGNKRHDYRLDLALRKENTIIIIEINTGNKELSEIKDYQYLFRIAGNMYTAGEDYKEKYVKLIRFNDFRDGKASLRHYQFKDETNKVIEFIESFEIYLPKYKRKDYNNAKEIEKTLMMFASDTEEEIRKYGTSEKNKKIIKELELLQMNEEFMGLYYDAEKVQKKWENSLRKKAIEDGLKKGLKQGLKQGLKNGVEKGMKQGMQQGVKQGIEKGMAQGMVEGIAKATTAMVKNLLQKNNMSIEEIAEIANVPIKEVEKLKEELNK